MNNFKLATPTHKGMQLAFQELRFATKDVNEYQ